MIDFVDQGTLTSLKVSLTSVDGTVHSSRLTGLGFVLLAFFYDVIMVSSAANHAGYYANNISPFRCNSSSFETEHFEDMHLWLLTILLTGHLCHGTQPSTSDFEAVKRTEEIQSEYGDIQHLLLKKMDNFSAKLTLFRSSQEDVRTSLDSVASLMKETRDTIESLWSDVALFEAAVEQLRAMSGCFAPWEVVRGMCLLFSNQLVTWPQARQFCEDEGEYLAWMVGVQEHAFIRSFVRRHRPGVAFWVGLHRDASNQLTWAGTRSSNYTGSPLVGRQSMFFASWSSDRRIFGTPSGWRAPIVCRRF